MIKNICQEEVATLEWMLEKKGARHVDTYYDEKLVSLAKTAPFHLVQTFASLRVYAAEKAL